MAIPARKNTPRSALRFWLPRVAVVGFALALIVVSLAVLNNNLPAPRLTRREFEARLDQVLGRSTDWTLQQFHELDAARDPTPEGRALLSNAATAYMMVDSASLSDNPRMKALGSTFVKAWVEARDVWGRLVDPSIAAQDPKSGELQALPEYMRWILHGAAPNVVALAPRELDNMFSPDRFRTGKATHQLFALYFYRKSQGSTPELERLMNRIAERIAWEAALDFRVTDLYLQRIAFLLAVGRADLVRPRWVERAFAAQQADGGWGRTWHGWTRTPYRLALADVSSNSHSTAQGMWIAYMLKYRYPQWIDKNYR